LTGACTADTYAVYVNGSTDGVSYTPGETSWTYAGTLLEGENTINVTAYDAAGNPSLADSITVTYEVPNVPPNASASATPTSGTAPLTVTFTGSGTDTDGTIASYSWDFGDGAISDEQNLTHIYDSAGTYTATLTVTDDDSATDSASTTISVSSGEKVSIYIEAESGTLVSPMIIGDDPDPQPCAGAYVYAPAGSGDTIEPTAEAVYDIEIPYAGDYYLWLRMHGPANDNDAIYIGFNGNFDRVYPPQWVDYQWVKVGTVYTLSAGINQINIEGNLGTSIVL